MANLEHGIRKVSKSGPTRSDFMLKILGKHKYARRTHTIGCSLVIPNHIDMEEDTHISWPMT